MSLVSTINVGNNNICREISFNKNCHRIISISKVYCVTGTNSAVVGYQNSCVVILFI